MNYLSTASTEEAATEDDVFVQSVRQEPCSKSPPAPPLSNDHYTHNYNFSGTAYDGSTSDAETDAASTINDVQDESDAYRRDFSGYTSISSFPASISEVMSRDEVSRHGATTPLQRVSTPRSSSQRAGSYERAPRSPKEYTSPFRHPSSVLAMQMSDEAMSDAQSVLRHHKRSGSRMSVYSQHSGYSAQTSPSKRSSRSVRNSPQKSGSTLRKEFPLVLLHCTLLPSNHHLKCDASNLDLVPELLPEKYKQRWVKLQEKLADVEISSRGVLINHPKDEYDLLEERLLESLELEQPRIRHDHYIPSGGNDSGFESASATDEEADSDKKPQATCPDCGSQVSPDLVDRRWEVRVFAANGLLRAGAWAAAWQEMEKVDVEINVSLPEEVRRDLESKLALLDTPPLESTHIHPDDVSDEQDLMSPREREIYGDPGRQSRSSHRGTSRHESIPTSQIDSPTMFQAKAGKTTGLAFPRLAFLYHDDRYVVPAFLGAFVLFTALWLARRSHVLAPAAAPQTEVAQLTPMETMTITATTTAISTTISVVTVGDQPPPFTSKTADDEAAEHLHDLEGLPSNLGRSLVASPPYFTGISEDALPSQATEADVEISD